MPAGLPVATRVRQRYRGITVRFSEPEVAILVGEAHATFPQGGLSELFRHAVNFWLLNSPDSYYRRRRIRDNERMTSLAGDVPSNEVLGMAQTWGLVAAGTYRWQRVPMQATDFGAVYVCSHGGEFAGPEVELSRAQPVRCYPRQYHDARDCLLGILIGQCPGCGTIYWAPGAIEDPVDVRPRFMDTPAGLVRVRPRNRANGLFLPAPEGAANPPEPSRAVPLGPDTDPTDPPPALGPPRDSKGSR